MSRERLNQLRKKKRLAELRAKRGGRTDFGDPVVEDGQFQVGGDVTIPVSEITAEMAKTPYVPDVGAAFENTLSAATAAAAAPVAGIVGLGQTINPFAPEGAGGETVRRLQDAMTYRPRGSGAQTQQQGLAELMTPVAEVIDKGRRGDEALESGAPPGIAALYEALPEMASGVMTIAGMPAIRGATNIPRLKASPKTGDVSPSKRLKPSPEWRFNDAGKLIQDPTIKPAIKAGWSEKAVTWAARQPRRVRDKMREMVDVADEYFHKMEADRLPSDVIGDPAAQRAAFVNQFRARAGRIMDQVAEGQLSKVRVDISKLRSELNIQARKLRGEVTPDGLQFGIKSKLSDAAGDATALIKLHEKLNSLGRMPTGLEVHDLKQWIDNYINAAKPGVKSDGAITGASQNVLLNIRKMANESLRKISEPYKAANDTYRETKTALDTLQKGAGNIDLFSDTAPEALGQAMRRLLSSAQARTNMRKGIDDVGKLAHKYSKGQLPYENYTPEMRFLSEMEKLWGSFKEESLKGNIGQVGQRLIENPSAAQGGREAVGIINKLRQPSRDQQLRVMKELLHQGGN